MVKILLVTFLFLVTHTSKSSSEEIEERIPILIPGTCPENQILFPKAATGDDWICDCGPGFLYYPPKDGCFAVYRQGPCTAENHLILKPDKKVAECVKNPCSDGHVRYKGKCYQIGSSDGPCAPSGSGGGTIVVNTTTLAIDCINNHDPLSLFNVPKNCPRGSKRDSNNECRENWNV